MTKQIPLNVTPLPVRLRVGDYLLLDGAGAFEAYAKTELIEGEILFMNAQHRPHARIKTELGFLLRTTLTGQGSHLAVLLESTVAMPPFSMPEPDIILTSEPRGEGPVPGASVALVVEVADATLDNDLRRKSVLYARHGVPECWVVDINGRTIHQLWRPGPDGYQETRNTLFGEVLEAATLPGLTVDTTALL